MTEIVTSIAAGIAFTVAAMAVMWAIIKIDIMGRKR